MTDLAYYTTGQLIAELLKRKTFVGIVIRSPLEDRQQEEHKQWHLHHTSNITLEQAHNVLQAFHRGS